MLAGMYADVLSANEAFYAAFRAGDLPAMEALWAEDAPVACVHPGWPALIGRDEVLASWRAIMASSGMPVRCAGARILMMGEVAQVICDERVGSQQVVATNVFVREAGAWRLVNHHAGHVAAPGPGSAFAPDDDEDPDDDDDGGGTDPGPN
jgi:ketosteroid isomerase-like protein